MGSARHPVFGTFNVRARRLVLVVLAAAGICAATPGIAMVGGKSHLEEATIDDIQQGIKSASFPPSSLTETSCQFS